VLVSWRQATPTEKLFNACATTLPFDKVLSRVNGIHIVGNYSKDMCWEVFSDGISPWIILCIGEEHRLV